MFNEGLLQYLPRMTRLMEQDTDGTVAAWQAAREDVIRPAIADHNGQIVKLTGILAG